MIVLIFLNVLVVTGALFSKYAYMLLSTCGWSRSLCRCVSLLPHLASCRWERCLGTPSPGCLSGLLGLPQEQGPGLCLSAPTCAKCIYSGWSHSGTPLCTPPTGSFSGKEFNFFREYFCFRLFGRGDGKYNCCRFAFPILTHHQGWLQLTDFYLLRLSHLQGIPVGLNNEEFIISYNKQSRGSSPGFVNIAAGQHQQVADYFHLFSDNLSISSQLSS